MRITNEAIEPVRPVALVFDPIRRADWSYQAERTILEAAGVELAIPADAAAAFAAAPAADVVIVSSRLPDDVFPLLGRCCGIVCYSVGTDGVDAALARDAGIPVRNVPDYCTEEVSDHALALVLAAERRIVTFANVSRSGHWAARRAELVTGIRRSSARTVGVVGLGRIGRRVAAKCQGIGMRVLGYDAVSDLRPEGIERVETLDGLLSAVDVVILCAALSATSRHLIDGRALSRMREGAGLVNVARGGLVDEPALLAALDSGRLGWAALDVRDPEPPAADDPLGVHPNVIATPHVAATSTDAWADLHRGAAAQVLAALAAAGRFADPAR
jgi:D-3-phosphoglycerate dehydrogenase